MDVLWCNNILKTSV